MPFTWWGTELPYHDHPYNTTRLNERAVELPIAHAWAHQAPTLEVGNVLSHYRLGPPRTIVDRHEKAPGVHNLDVFDITDTYDQIISISTIEHVRWDEHPRTPGGSAKAIAHLVSLLNPGGRMLITIPTGCNPPLDDALPNLGATRACTLVRDGNDWTQTPTVEVHPYGVSQPWAHSVWIGEWW